MKKIFTLAILLLCCNTIFAQRVEVSGTVWGSDTPDPLIGARILVVGSAIATLSDVDGCFTIAAQDGAVLAVSLMGYATQEIEVKNGMADLKIMLEPDIAQIDEVVVIGYGTQKKSLTTGSSSSIKSKDIARPGVTRVDEALQGKAAGVSVTSNSGQPGEGISIRIRGAGTNGDAAPLYIVDGVQLSNIDFLNPSDIATMEILKDAASSAIYGARGANGVIMITTNHGSYGDALSITADVSYGIQNLRQKMNLTDATSYMILQNEAAVNSGASAPFSSTEIANAGSGTDWQEQILNRNAPIMNAQLNFAGGSEKTRYNVSGSYSKQEGIFAPGKSDYERVTFRESTDSRYFDDHFSFGQSLIISSSAKQGIDVNNTWGGPLLGAINMDPVTPVYNEDGSYAISSYVAQEVVNPVAQAATINTTTDVFNVIGNLYMELNFLKDFKVRTSLAVETSYTDYWYYAPVYQLNSSVLNTEASVTNTSAKSLGYQLENTLTYDKEINGHTIQALIGNTVREYNGTDIGATKSGLLIDEASYAYLSLAKNEDSATAWGGAWHSALVSYFGRVNYSYANKYMLSATFRADGSSRFGSNNRFGYFPSVSVGWNIANESFMESVENVNQLKLRASWGQNGNESIGDWQYLATISTSSRGYEFGDVIYSGASPDKVSNPDIKWETSEQIDIGIDALFFDKFGLTLDYYIKDTKDLLVYAPIPSYVGASAAASNAGSVRNSGVELALSYTDSKGDWDWYVNFNIAYNKNVVTEVGNDEGYIAGATVGTAMNSVTRMEVGKPISYFWGYVTDGIFQTQDEVDSYTDDSGNVIQPDAVAGDFKYVDINGDGVIDDSDRTMIGDPNPDFTGGLSAGVNWKGFDFSVLFTGVYGNEIFNATRRWDLPMSNYDISALERWHGEGTSDTYPRLTWNDTNGNYSKPSDFFIEDGSYLRLKSLTLGYTFNFDKAKMYMSKIRLYVAANNLWTLTNYSGYDPEIGNSGVLYNGIDYGMYPLSQSFILGLNITF